MTMESSAEARPVIALLCTRGMEAFLVNSLRGILRAGIDPRQIYIGCPENAFEAVSHLAQTHAREIRVIPNQTFSKNDPAMENYSEYDSPEFTEICWQKILFLRGLLETHGHVIYADLDIVWLRDPLPYLSKVALHYPMAFQTEALPQFPPALCFGFASFVKSEKAIAFLDALIAFDLAQATEGRVNDQVAGQRLVANDPAWLRHIYCLPEGLFLNGLNYRNLQNYNPAPCPMEGELAPFLFHANWTIGEHNKRWFLAHMGMWLLEEPGSDS